MIKLLDCTLRDGGYYNNWDFSVELIQSYLEAVNSAGVDIVELGFRTLKNSGYRGPCAFTTDDFIRSLNIPDHLKIGVMINGSELIGSVKQEQVLESLFADIAENSPVDLVRIACHVNEFEDALPAASWLKERGYLVGFNLMQITDCPEDKIKYLAEVASRYPVDVLYFADSLGSMSNSEVIKIVKLLLRSWHGAIGIHAHDNLGLALSNTLCAIDNGVTWVDSTVAGMGRGPGNARTEELSIDIAELRGKPSNLMPLMQLINSYFKPVQNQFKWGTNPYYYLAGKYGIHPTYIQEMLGDARYNEEDIFTVIEYLRMAGGAKFSSATLDFARHFYYKPPRGSWSPSTLFEGRDVLLLGNGGGVARHRDALERYIDKHSPVVLALNTQDSISINYIDMYIACHPVRLLSDFKAHAKLAQPLITPLSMLPHNIQTTLINKKVFDFGLAVEANTFEFFDTYCVTPTSLVVAYALAVATSGKARRIFMAGFDGYKADDLRLEEMRNLLDYYQKSSRSLPLIAITPSRYEIEAQSVYFL